MTTLPDAELLVTAFLRQEESVTSQVGDNIFTELPGGFSAWPAVRVVRIGGSPAFQPLVLDQPLVQVDVWGGPKRTAVQVAEAIRSALAERLPFVLPTVGTLGGVERFGSLRYSPDPTYDPARPRWTFEAVLVTRPDQSS